MNNSTKIILTISSLAFLLAGCRRGNQPTTQTSSTTSGATVTTGTTEPVPSDYYSSISDSLTGQELLNALHSLNNTKKTREVGYDESLNKPKEGFLVTDHSLAEGKENYITGFYSGTDRKGGNGMNREHVWPNSRGGNLVENDIHMIRPTIKAENEGRGNSFYVEGKNSDSSGWDPKAAGLKEDYRGDSARIIFYCAIANTQLTIVDKENDGTSNKTMGKLSDLLKWNLQYSVQERERVRNNGAQTLQGNRNPFIDNPSYACRIWGNTNSTTRSICGL